MDLDVQVPQPPPVPPPRLQSSPDYGARLQQQQQQQIEPQREIGPSNLPSSKLFTPSTDSNYGDQQQVRTANNWPQQQYLKPPPANFNSPPSSTNVLSSQEFKDELKLQQARLSPTHDAPLSIDEKIRLAKEQGHQGSRSVSRASNESSSNQQHTMQPSQRHLPDSLMSTSTLQRDKQPFAYSPDVSDPKNRGKLDLSHIKSPTMRRRLLANMESSSSDGENGEPGEIGGEESVRVLPAPQMARDLSSARKTGPPLKTFAPSAQHTPGYQLQQRQHPQQQQAEQAPQVQYSAQPPVFYNSRSDTSRNYIIHLPENAAPAQTGGRNPHVYSQDLIRNSTRPVRGAPPAAYEKDLSAEIASSLESLSLLANNLDKSVRDCNRSFVQRPNNYDYSVRREPQFGQPQQPTRGVPDPYAYGAHDEGQRPTPGFYSVLPSGRRVNNEHSTFERTATTTTSPEGYYQNPYDIYNSAPTRQAPNVVNRPTSQGTFYNTATTTTNQHWDPTHGTSVSPHINYNSARYHGDQSHHGDGMSSQFYSSPSVSSISSRSTERRLNQQAPWSPQQQPQQRGFVVENGGAWRRRSPARDREDQVAILRNMTAQLEREVSRLHELRPDSSR